MALQIVSTISDPLFQSNSYILYCDETGEGIICDPGSVSSFIQHLEKEAITLKAIVNTHGHLDHLGGAAATQEHFDIPLYIHEDEKRIVRNLNQYVAEYGLPAMAEPRVNHWMVDGEIIKFGNLDVEVIHTPGHSPGSVCIYHPGHLITGDTVFNMNIGRADLDGGNHDVLINSIKTRILTLPPGTNLYPGHGPVTTVGYEAQHNPWLQ
jgi:glyoxylase-like metal-dependent hydrolase (beta-lactamase superfamily II)